MNDLQIIEELRTLLIKYNISDFKLLENNLGIIIPVDEELPVPKYNIAANFLKENYLEICLAFRLKKFVNDDKHKFLELLTELNKKSFLTYNIVGDFLKVNYIMPEVEDNDAVKILKIITIIPTHIDEAFGLIRPFLA